MDSNDKTPMTSLFKTIATLALGGLLAQAAWAAGPGVAKFDESSFEVLEGAGMAVITVERSQGEDGVVSVDYRTSGLSATPGEDYEDVAGTLTWANNDGSDRTFTIPILDDDDAEGAESVVLMLENPTGGMTLDGERAMSELVILSSDNGGGGGGGDDGGGDDGGGGDGGGDDGSAGTLKLGSGSYQVLESAGNAVIRVERSKGETGAVSVSYAVDATGSASPGSDYTSVTGTLSWAAGDGSDRTFLVPILDDANAEGNENLEVAIFAPTGGAGLDPLRSTAILTIVDDDSAAGGCAAGSSTLCLLDGKFSVEIDWRDFQDRTGSARAVALSDGSGLFWFFNSGNFEVLVKMIDACEGRGAQWLFLSSTTNVELEVRVTDTRTGEMLIYTNPLGRTAAPLIDTTTFSNCAP